LSPPVRRVRANTPGASGNGSDFSKKASGYRGECRWALGRRGGHLVLVHVDLWPCQPLGGRGVQRKLRNWGGGALPGDPKFKPGLHTVHFPAPLLAGQKPQFPDSEPVRPDVSRDVTAVGGEQRDRLPIRVASHRHLRAALIQADHQGVRLRGANLNLQARAFGRLPLFAVDLVGGSPPLFRLVGKPLFNVSSVRGVRGKANVPFRHWSIHSWVATSYAAVSWWL